MGFYSFKTGDTDRSIANKYSDLETFAVHMITPDGRSFTERDYEGYGEFGNKDFYELLAELNGLDSDRSKGIDLVFKNNPSGDNTPGVIYPKFAETLSADVVGQYNSLSNPTSCPDQGFFFIREEDDEDLWEDDEEEEEEED